MFFCYVLLKLSVVERVFSVFRLVAGITVGTHSVGVVYVAFNVGGYLLQRGAYSVGIAYVPQYARIYRRINVNVAHVKHFVDDAYFYVDGIDFGVVDEFEVDAYHARTDNYPFVGYGVFQIFDFFYRFDGVAYPNPNGGEVDQEKRNYKSQYAQRYVSLGHLSAYDCQEKSVEYQPDYCDRQHFEYS